MKLSTVVGVKLVLNLALNGHLRKCVKLENPIP
jgi:hypothetical protein